jgi:hypothetical protein
MERGATGERRQPTTTPTVYSYRKTLQPTCLAWQENKLGCSRRREKKKCSDRINFKEVDMPEHLYRLMGVRSEQVNKRRELKAVNHGMSCELQQW